MNRSKQSALRVICTLLADFLLFGGVLLLFALFHHVLPQRFEKEQTLTSEQKEKGNTHFDWETSQDSGVVTSEASSDIVSAASEEASDDSETSEKTEPEPMTEERLIRMALSGKRYPYSPFSRTSSEIGCYLGDNALIRLCRENLKEGSGSPIVYYVADIFLSSATDLHTYVCKDGNGNVCDGSIKDAAKASGAVFAVNTDYFKSRSWGIYVRDGLQYLNAATKNDVCVIYLDGSMEIFRKGKVDESAIREKGAWQIFTFGPSLFNEKGMPYTVDTDMNITSTYNNAFNNTHIYGFRTPNPRTAVGYVSPGHFVLVTVDGRQKGYSVGASLTELAQIMYDEGCTLAYNLDGGGSSQMYFNGEMVNSPAKGRSPSDYLVIFDTRKEETSDASDRQ